MKRLLLAVLALGVLLMLIGCPPSTDTSDRFGPGPDRPVVTDDQPVDDQPVSTSEGEAAVETGEAGAEGAEGEKPSEEGTDGDEGGGGKPSDDLAGGE